MRTVVDLIILSVAWVVRSIWKSLLRSILLLVDTPHYLFVVVMLVSLLIGYLDTDLWVVVFFSFVLCSSLVYWYVRTHGNISLRVAVVVCACITTVLRIWGVNVYENEVSKVLSELSGKDYVVGTVVEEPIDKGEEYRVVIEVDGVRLIGRTDRLPTVKYGYLCEGDIEISIPRNNMEFDYKSYLRSKRIYGEFRGYDLHCKDPTSGNIRYNLIRWRDSLVASIEENIPEPESSLLAGILFGVTRYFPTSFDDSLQVSGTTHIIAASGYNVTVLVVLVDRALGRLPRGYRLVLSLLSVWGYTVIAGLSPSIVRAAVMVSTILIARILGLGVLVNKVYVLLLTACAIGLVWPGTLMQVSFLLSVSATAGIYILLPKVEAIYEKVFRRTSSFMKDYVLTTLSVSLATAPVLLSVFNNVSLMGLISNLLILPVLESTMLVGTVAILIYMLFNVTLGRWIFLAVYVQLKYFSQMVIYMGKWEGMSVVNTWITWCIALGMIIGILLVEEKEGGDFRFPEVDYYSSLIVT